MFVFSNGIAINLYEVLWADKYMNTIYVYFKCPTRGERVRAEFACAEQIEIEFSNLIERLNQILNKERA